MNFRDDYQARLDGEWTDIRQHLPYLFEVACRYPNVRVLELGTRAGHSTSAFLAAAEEVGGHVWSVDIAEPETPDWWRDSGLWSLTVEDDITTVWPRHFRVDVLFIDSSHILGATLAELYRFTPMVDQGGVVLCHDTQWIPPKEQGGQIIMPPVPDGPVKIALDLFCLETRRQWRNHPGSFGLGEIEVR